MFKRVFPLESGGQAQQLELIWGLFWRNFVIQLDGQTIGTVSGGLRSLREGVEIILPEGSSLRIQAENTIEGIAFLVTRDGIPLPGSTLSPDSSHNLAASPDTIQYLLLFLLTLIPLALLLWLGIWVEEAARGISDTARWLISLGIFLAYLFFLLFFVLRARRASTRTRQVSEDDFVQE